MGEVVMDIGPFEPPYELGGSAFVAIGTWKRDVAQAAPAGFSPLRLFGRQLGILVGSNFERPPEELPIRYREIVAATVVRRWLPPAGQERTPVHDEVRAQVDVERRLRAELTSWLEHELDDRVVRIVEERLAEQDERRAWRRTREVF